MTKHPRLHQVDVTCSSCGTTHRLASTISSVTADVCSACHPAYTGRSREARWIGDRIERFNRRREAARGGARGHTAS